MEERVILQFEALRPAIKKRWEVLLRAEPVASPLANPDTLVYLMNETLTQLTTILRTRSLSSWLRHHKALGLPQQSRCDCSINPLLAYYNTGSQALLEAGTGLGPELNSILLFYHGLAQREIDALCGACCQTGFANCPQRIFDPAEAHRASGSRR